MKKFFKTILLGMISILSLVGCNNTQDKGSGISISSSDVNVIRHNYTSQSDGKYYFKVLATYTYPDADLFGYFKIYDSSNKILEDLKDVKGAYSSADNTYTFKAEIQKNTYYSHEKYTSTFKGTAYVKDDGKQEFLVDDKYVTATNLTISGKKAKLTIKSLYNLTYLSYEVSLYFNTYTGPMKIEGEISENIPANKTYTFDLGANINFSQEMSAFTFEVKKAKTKDSIDNNKIFEDKKYSYIFLDLEDCLFASKLVNANTSPIFNNELEQNFKYYPYLTFNGYKTENGVVKASSTLPKATKNLVFKPEVEIDDSKYIQEAKDQNDVQKSCLKVVLEYYDTVLGIIKYTAAESHGSGVVIGGEKTSNNGHYYALTNYHVVDAIVEKNYSGHEGIRGKVIDCDKQEYTYTVYATDKQHDLAMIRFDANKTIHSATIDFPGYDELKYDYIMAIGCPGDSFLKITTGKYTGPVSGKNSFGYTQTCIAHTASTDKGSSGGPIFNWRLQVVGLTMGKGDGKNVAVSLSDIRNFISQYNYQY